MNKNFKDFREYTRKNGQAIHESIHQKVLQKIDEAHYDDIVEESEDYRRAWVEIGVVEILEHYHNWLMSEE